MVKDVDNAKIYVTDTLNDKKAIIDDLKQLEKRIIVVSSSDNVLSIYGAILEAYNNYNLYKVDELSDVDDEYVDNIKDIDRSKDEVILYVGKTLNERVNEVISKIKCTKEEKMVLDQVKEVIKGFSSDNKTEAELNVLYKKIDTLTKDNNRLKDELSLFQTEKRVGDSGNEIKEINEINVDLLIGANKHILYFRELNRLMGFKTLIRQYIKYLFNKYNLKTKILIIDPQTKYRYKKEEIIQNTDQYQSDRKGYREKQIIVMNFPIPYIVNECITDNQWDVLIVIDRMCDKILLKGEHVNNYVLTSSKTEINNYKKIENIDENVTFIGDKDVIGDGITIANVFGEDLTKPNIQYYVYCNMMNTGSDNRLIFDILDTNSKMEVKKEV